MNIGAFKFRINADLLDEELQHCRDVLCCEGSVQCRRALSTGQAFIRGSIFGHRSLRRSEALVVDTVKAFPDFTPAWSIFLFSEAKNFDICMKW